MKLLSCSDMSSGYIMDIYKGRQVWVHTADVRVNKILWSRQTS